MTQSLRVYERLSTAGRMKALARVLNAIEKKQKESGQPAVDEDVARAIVASELGKLAEETRRAGKGGWKA